MTDLFLASDISPIEDSFYAQALRLSDIELIHAISVELIGEQDRVELYGRIVEAAVAITRSQFGTMQSLCPKDDPSDHEGELQLLAYRGFQKEAVQFWRWVKPTAYSSCTAALKLGRRVVIRDYEAWEEIADTEDLRAFRRAGIRSAQTTPLLSRGGELLGMISTHWSEPNCPTDRDLALLDILARQAADLLDRTIAEEKLHRLNEMLESRVEERSRELLASEDQVRQLQKIEAMGQLTGGVAHDFNNLLTIIRSSAELLARRELPREKQKMYISAIVDTADRAAKLTGQLLAFARRQPLRPEIFDAVARVETVADMLRVVVGSRVHVIVDPISAPCYIDVDASQFETALVNMAVNARDAMNGEGRLNITIEVTGCVPARRGHAATPGKFMKLSVTDAGSGMGQDQLAHLFEPFYTTKEIGKGTGLGLSQVYSFTKSSGGEIDVVSEIDKGTTFCLFLPVAQAPADIVEIHALAKASLSNTSILVVEDNEQVGEFTSQILRDLGLTTYLATSALRAIAILESEPDLIDIVFSDVVMPGIDGFELGKRIRTRWPEIKVVLTSGYSHVLAGDPEHGFPLLHKPYSVEELSGALLHAQQQSPYFSARTLERNQNLSGKAV